MKMVSAAPWWIEQKEISKGNSDTRKTLMCSSILASESASATISLFQLASPEACSRLEQEAEFHRLHIDWVLVTDTKGDRRPSMHWQVG